MGEEHHSTSLRLTLTASGGAAVGRMVIFVAEVGIEHVESMMRPPLTEHVPIFLPNPVG